MILGQLTGGDASCSNLTGPDYYGKFSHSWDQIGDTDTTQLKPWLDPDNTGIEILGGLVSTVEIIRPDKNIRIYPNPTTGPTFIELQPGFNKDGLQIEILDVSGRRLFTKEFPEESPETLSLDLTGFDKGIYFVKITNRKNQMITKKLLR